MRLRSLALCSVLVPLALTSGCVRTTRSIYYPDTGTADPDRDGDGYTVGDGDCDDDNPAIHPDAEEVCDGLNNDCDGGIDEDAVDGQLLYMDGDGDGWGNEDVTILACGTPPGFISQPGDCDDAAPTTYPGAEEIRNDGVDNNCNGDITSAPSPGRSRWRSRTRASWGTRRATGWVSG